MQFQNNDGVNILGPYEKTKKLKDIPELSFMQTVQEFMGDINGVEDFEDLRLIDIFPVQHKNAMTKKYTHVFVGVRPYAGTAPDLGARENESLTYDLINQENVEFYTPPATTSMYLGIKPDAIKQINKAQERATQLFLVAKKDILLFGDARGVGGDVLQLPYVKTKMSGKDRDTDEDNPDLGDSVSAGGGGGASISSDGEDVSDNFEYKYYNTIINGADGNPLKPTELLVSNGFIGEIQALEDNVSKNLIDKSREFASSSETLYKLSIPEIDITLSSLSLRYTGGQGVTTTINRSTKELIALGDEVIVAKYFQSNQTSSIARALTATQKNYFNI